MFPGDQSASRIPRLVLGEQLVINLLQAVVIALLNHFIQRRVHVIHQSELSIGT